jgi:hypothetical protein
LETLRRRQTRRLPGDAGPIKFIGIALISGQYETRPEDNASTQATLGRFLGAARATTLPSSVEWSPYTEANGFYNLYALAHWHSKPSCALWAATSGVQYW